MGYKFSYIVDVLDSLIEEELKNAAEQTDEINSDEVKIEIHNEFCNLCHETYVNKNSDYGNSYSKLREKFPDSILIRLNDKLNRLETLMLSEKEKKVHDESIEDTLLDMANYCLMELTERTLDDIEQSLDNF